MEFTPGSEAFGEDLLMDQGPNDISLTILRQESIDHMLSCPSLQCPEPVDSANATSRKV